MTCIFVSGGSGGHLFPAIRLAYEFKGFKKTILFTDERGERFLPKKLPFEKCIIHKLRDDNKTGTGSFLRLGLSFLKCLFLLIRIRPSIVIGFGGYPSIPCTFAAQILGIPTVLHEQNLNLSKANLFLAKRAKLVLTSFKETKHPKSLFVGNFVRKEIEELYDKEYTPPVDKFNLLIIGGSQGANIFLNKLPVILKKLQSKDKLIIHHQIGENNFYNDDIYNGLDATIKPFFYNMEEEYKWAHLVIGRAGASTISELSIAKRPAILIPIKGASDQKKNIEALKDSVITIEEYNIKEIGYAIEALMNHPERLLDLSNKIHSFAVRNSSKTALYELKRIFFKNV